MPTRVKLKTISEIKIGPFRKVDQFKKSIETLTNK